MDNRTGFRHRGPAYLADQARQTLGVAIEPRPLAEIPAPLVHTAFGAAVCAVAVLIRPETLGLRQSALASTGLALLTAGLLAGYDRLVYPAASRPSVDSLALPVAAVAAFATVLAGVPQLGVRIAAGFVAALVIGGVPQLIGRQVAGYEGWAHRLLRDVAGVAVLAPVLVAGASPVLPALPRFALVAAVALLVSFDTMRTELLGGIRALPIAGVIGALVGGASYLAGTSTTNAGIRAAVLLVLWYGLRGVGGALGAGDLRRSAIIVAEYAAFVVLAAGALRWVVLNS